MFCNYSQLVNTPDPSGPSDQEIKIVNVSECIKLNEGKVKVIREIFTVSKPYKVISEIGQKCSCGITSKRFEPPL
jgi:hypothetical protein